jgi:2-polyprenyl-3-methyl-5-hydroxy-6-metoxy-1,4-benzoquinol methylase
MKCRHCGEDVTLTLIDLGSSPPSNAYLTKLTMRRPEKWFPLKVLVCESCWLVQAEAYSRAAELFNDEYAYFSSFSAIWLAHAERYVKEMVERLGLNTHSRVIEVASNDGYLLQYIKQRNIPCLGIEPTASTASAARQKGIDTLEEFFSVNMAERLVKEGKQTDLMVANNVLAHVPDINDFVKGFAKLLKPQGIATFEFPHLMHLIDQKQFDTIYHEHFSYLSFSAVSQIFTVNGLTVFDVEELETHGGSLRVFAQRSDTGKYPISKSVSKLLDRETEVGMRNGSYYQGFQEKANKVKNDLLDFLLNAKKDGKTVAAYGAAAKGNTLLNYAGIKPDLIPFVCDASPSKQGKYLPGSRIPILPPTALKESKPDIILIIPWNIAEEIIQQHTYVREWGGLFVAAVPEIKIMDFKA